MECLAKTERRIKSREALHHDMRRILFGDSGSYLKRWCSDYGGNCDPMLVKKELMVWIAKFAFFSWLPDLTAAASLPGCQAERIPLTLVVGKRGNWWRPPTAASLLAAFVMSSPTSLGKQFVDLCPTPTCSTGMKLSTISLKSQVVP